MQKNWLVAFATGQQQAYTSSSSTPPLASMLQGGTSHISSSSTPLWPACSKVALLTPQAEALHLWPACSKVALLTSQAEALHAGQHAPRWHFSHLKQKHSTLASMLQGGTSHISSRSTPCWPACSKVALLTSQAEALHSGQHAPRWHFSHLKQKHSTLASMLQGGTSHISSRSTPCWPACSKVTLLTSQAEALHSGQHAPRWHFSHLKQKHSTLASMLQGGTSHISSRSTPLWPACSKVALLTSQAEALHSGQHAPRWHFSHLKQQHSTLASMLQGGTSHISSRSTPLWPACSKVALLTSQAAALHSGQHAPRWHFSHLKQKHSTLASMLQGGTSHISSRSTPLWPACSKVALLTSQAEALHSGQHAPRWHFSHLKQKHSTLASMLQTLSLILRTSGHEFLGLPGILDL